MGDNSEEIQLKLVEFFKQNALSASSRVLSKNIKTNISFIQSSENITISSSKEGEILIEGVSNQIILSNKNFVRGIIDSESLRICYNDPLIFEQFLPIDDFEISCYKLMEKARYEAIGIDTMPGIKTNIEARNKVLISKELDVDEILYLLVSKYLSNLVIEDFLSDNILEKFNYIKDTNHKFLLSLKKAIDKQSKFAKISIKIISKIKESKLNSDIKEEKDLKGKKNISSTIKNKSFNIDDNNDNNENNKNTKDIFTKKQVPPQKKLDKTILKAISKNNITGSQYFIDKEVIYENNEDYKVFTSEFDEVINVEKLISIDELLSLKKRLDIKMSKLQSISHKNRNILKSKLMSKQKISWEYNRNEGMIDSNKLSNIIARPYFLEYYKDFCNKVYPNTIITLLIDNSASMHGNPIAIAAMSTDILTSILEKFNISVEVLGFTTKEWKGGQSYKKWLSEGSIKNPGRLNDLRYIVYKYADTTWRQSHKNFSLMLQDNILKENIDGEALLWAFKRIIWRPEKRKIIMVISDGSPVDDSTTSANQSDFLDKHLKKVIKKIEKNQHVELTAIGIGHDVSNYYSTAATIKNSEDLGNTMCKQLCDLF